MYLVNTGMGSNQIRFPLDFTRNCVKQAIDLTVEDDSENVLKTLEKLIQRILKEKQIMSNYIFTSESVSRTLR